MTELQSLQFACGGAACCFAVGLSLGILAKRWPLRAEVALGGLLFCAVLFANIEPAGDKNARLPLAFAYSFTTPIAILYSWFCFRAKTNRLIGLAALVGAILMALLLAFYVAGCLYVLFASFTLNSQ